MKLRAAALPVLLVPCFLAVLAGGGSVGCEENSMNKDLKRQADRASLRLNQAENERDAFKDEVAKEKSATEAERKRADAALQEATDLRRRLTTVETELMSSRQEIRRLQDAALAARQGMPTTRSLQP